MQTNGNDLNGVNTLLQTRVDQRWKTFKPLWSLLFCCLCLKFCVGLKQTDKKLNRSSSDPMFCVILVCGPLQLMCIFITFWIKQQDWMSPLNKKYQVIIIMMITIIIIIIIIIIMCYSFQFIIKKCIWEIAIYDHCQFFMIYATVVSVISCSIFISNISVNYIHIFKVK